ncbi:tudor domain-containing protein 1 [Orycteropus afer afer]|uniref:Tudor domain-containing protein 1 n=1 Tax=Orycteropus afer afer TaxID=1230840 RepID=A0A8B6ZVU2_ORYAF|nr:tudor domain-containing protein 1 [Orycteropus afer afer]
MPQARLPHPTPREARREGGSPPPRDLQDSAAASPRLRLPKGVAGTAPPQASRLQELSVWAWAPWAPVFCSRAPTVKDTWLGSFLGARRAHVGFRSARGSALRMRLGPRAGKSGIGGERSATSVNVKIPVNMMSRNNSEASICKMAEPNNFEKNENKLIFHDSLRSPGGYRNHPNFRLKSPESGNKKNNFLLCEQTKQYLACQEDNSGSSNPNGINGEVVTLPTGNSLSPLSIGNNSPPKDVNAKPSNNVHPTKSRTVHKLIENSLSINSPSLFNSLGPPLRFTTCHCCGLFGSLRCSQCKQTYYCSIACQRRDWSAHSIVCKPVQQNQVIVASIPATVATVSLKQVLIVIYIHVFSTQADCSLGVSKETTLCAEKIMFSDLRSLQLRKTTEIKGAVTEFKHPGDFHVQLCSSEVVEYMNQLSVSLKETYAKLLEEDYIPVKGEVCVAKYTVDQTWNRVVIQGVDVQQKMAHVSYIDYGNEETIPVNRIHQLSRTIDLFPPCVRKSLDQVLIEMGYGLQPKKQGADQIGSEDAGKMTAEDKIVVDRNDLIPKVLTLNVGDEFCGVVAHIQTPEDFFCQQLQSGHKLAELQASLGDYCGRVSPCFDFFPTIGDICCAQFSEDDQWYRASVLAYASEDSVLVGYVDYGNFEILSLTRLCPIIPKLLDLPMQAIKCVLTGMRFLWSPFPLGVEAKADLLEWAWVELAVDQTVDVVVSMIYTPGEFYCHVLKEDAINKLNDLNKSLAEYCQQKLPNGFKAELGQPCCAFFAGDGSWYRALVKEILPNKNIRVHFVDYGNIEEVTADELQTISSKFLKLPFQGIQCWLADTQPRNKHWTKEATARFQMCVTGTKLQARVVEITEEGVGIELTDLSTSYPRIISDVLIGEALVSAGASPAKDVPSSRPVNKCGPHIDVQGPQAISSAEQWRTVELPVNKTVRANILEITNTNLFYALPNEMPEDQEKLSVLTAELLEYCNARRSPLSYSPRIGEACCARYSSDDLWYRAIVLGTSDAHVTVLYADYGNIETLPLSRVQPIATSLLELPFQIVRCSLEGLMELNGSCSHLIIELLKNFLLNQNVMISVKGINKNVHTVAIEKCVENGPVHVGSKLMCGLVKNNQFKKQSAFNKERTCRTYCCCTELQKQVEKHEQILRFLLNSPTNQNKLIEMKKLLS